MKIVLSKNDVMRLICEDLHISVTETMGGGVIPERDVIRWEGNPDEEMIGREAAKEPKKEKWECKIPPYALCRWRF